MESEAAAPQLEEAGPLLELLLQHLQALFGGGGASLPAGLAFVCTDRQRDPAAAAAIIGACWRALTLRQVWVGENWVLSAWDRRTWAAQLPRHGVGRRRGATFRAGNNCPMLRCALCNACPASTSKHHSMSLYPMQCARWGAPAGVAFRRGRACRPVGGAGGRQRSAHRRCEKQLTCCTACIMNVDLSAG